MRCNLCPRRCDADRDVTVGFCGMGSKIRVAKIMLHKWEEPCISGDKGSGAIFFSGCNLRCVYCQNAPISHACHGTEISADELGEKMLELQSQGAHNINLVTPTHFSSAIREAIDKVRLRLEVPIVYNTSGYESVEAIRSLDGYVDIFLTDMKYFDSALSQEYSAAADYYEVAANALDEMLKIAPECVFDGQGMMKRGVIVRHLVLPSHRADSIHLLENLSRRIDISKIRLSLMSQYTPDFYKGEKRALRRRITTFEYQSVAERAIELGYTGYFQEIESASKKYTPDFE